MWWEKVGLQEVNCGMVGSNYSKEKLEKYEKCSLSHAGVGSWGNLESV